MLFVRVAKIQENIVLASLPLELGAIYFKVLKTAMQTYDLCAHNRHFSLLDKHLCMVVAQVVSGRARTVKEISL